MLFESSLRIIMHWSKWWCSMVEVEYKTARGDMTFDCQRENVKFYVT